MLIGVMSMGRFIRQIKSMLHKDECQGFKKYICRPMHLLRSPEVLAAFNFLF